MRSRILFPFLLLFFPSSLLAQSYRVGVDPRVELLSIVFHLAGNPEYTQGRVPSYSAAIDSYFAPYKDHPAVLMARELRETDGVSFDAPMNLAVHLGELPGLAERVPFDDPAAGLDERWHGVKARRFVEALRSFVTDTKFMEFLKLQQALYDVTNERLQKFVATNMDLAWYDRFYGVHSSARLIVVPGLVNGGPSYGSGFSGKDGVQEMYSIPGVGQVDAQGLPVFSGDFLETAVHEFVHSYSNGLVDQFYGQLAKAGDELYKRESIAMERQAYGDSKVLLQESMVRAATARYIFEHQGPEAARRDVELESAHSFYWVEGLSDLFGTYEKERAQYPTLEAFMPNVVKFFNEVAPKVGEMQRQYDGRRPRIVEMNIHNGSQDVDPNLTEIRVRFDRPMDKAKYAVARTDADLFPKMGKVSFDESGTVFTMPVTLQPNHEYKFSLNWPGGGSFRSTEGVFLKDVEVEFRTRSRGSVATRH